ncbi:putative Rho GTPase-activating protein [Smittium mucronatum]|uniref:Putative Rho GTPase-activating protein n=1 Tax=Smittium mucronatum TaxID=133383 RepID=A0A1R0GS17_9FUNG|nr:putative Rho GTPase-activating protein [Smittium mucronatum]
MSKEAEIVYPSMNFGQGRYFGVPLEILMGENGERGIPVVVSDIIDYIFSNGLRTPDLFRRNVQKQTSRKIKAEYEVLEKSSVAYGIYGEYAAATMLKIWISELPQPLVPSQLYDLVKSIPAEIGDLDAAIYIRDVVLPAMGDPPCTLILLSVVVKLLVLVSENSEYNGMTPIKLATSMAPCWVHSSYPDLDIEMVSVTRFREPLPEVEVDVPRPLIIDEDSEVAPILPKRPRTPSNVVTLIRVMIQFYDLIFKPTLETFSKNNRYGTGNTTELGGSLISELDGEDSSVPPPKPKRRGRANTQTVTDTSLPSLENEFEVKVKIEEIDGPDQEELEIIEVQPVKEGDVGIEDLVSLNTEVAQEITAEEVAKRLLEENLKERQSNE